MFEKTCMSLFGVLLAVGLVGCGPSVQVEGDCSVLPDARLVPACEAFVENQRRYVLPALEELSGVELGRCYERIAITFRERRPEDRGLAAAYTEEGHIDYLFEQAEAMFDPDAIEVALYDSHEMLHMLYRCAGVPHEENYHHSSWDAVEAELEDRIAAASGFEWSTRLSERFRAYASENFDFYKSYPQVLDEPGGRGGCHGLKTALVYGEYGRTGGAVIRRFFEALRTAHSPSLVPKENTPLEKSRYNELVLGLLPPDEVPADQVARYCE
ncbi:hypothetical protein [Vitiosangium sp. GDMCC 1.1324]|uniref:hypothetical protein n=1 Tax=Vitiosangium sp. (strain GDMCC 1.1324) TaxID=2138576 RepID=UPI000D3D10CB|nr:hypothetical protein [Vitiosangium sp. GDMCC 1.1324]PTL84504.1 hypothetical protein DAT35_05290 [Vitiosangium sp. GDMCC 1.1324]